MPLQPSTTLSRSIIQLYQLRATFLIMETRASALSLVCGDQKSRKSPKEAPPDRAQGGVSCSRPFLRRVAYCSFTCSTRVFLCAPLVLPGAPTWSWRDGFLSTGSCGNEFHQQPTKWSWTVYKREASTSFLAVEQFAPPVPICREVRAVVPQPLLQADQPLLQADQPLLPSGCLAFVHSGHLAHRLAVRS